MCILAAVKFYTVVPFMVEHGPPTQPSVHAENLSCLARFSAFPSLMPVFPWATSVPTCITHPKLVFSCLASLAPKPFSSRKPDAQTTAILWKLSWPSEVLTEGHGNLEWIVEEEIYRCGLWMILWPILGDDSGNFTQFSYNVCIYIS